MGDLDTVLELVRTIRIGLLTSFHSDGELDTRPVETLGVEEDGTLWFFTERDSGKVTELRNDVRTSLGYADPRGNRFVAISGRAALLRDPGKARQLWTAEQRAFYPAGPGDERLTLVRVRIERARYWLPPGRTGYLVAALQAAVTGSPAGVIGESGAVQLPRQRSDSASPADHSGGRDMLTSPRRSFPQRRND